MFLLSRYAASSIDTYLIQKLGIPRDILIEHAGIAVSKHCALYLDSQKSQGVNCAIHIFAGKGMNGLDAFACARNLHAFGYKVNLWEVFPSRDSMPNWHRDSCAKIGIPIRPASEYQVEENSLIVDGVFGTSFTLEREFSTFLKDLFDKINSNHTHSGYILSIDLPSGVDTDTGKASSHAITADETVTFFSPKIGIISYPGRKYAGVITVETIGIPTHMIEKILLDLLKSNTQFNSQSQVVEVFADSLPMIPDSLPIMLDLEAARQLIPSRPSDGHKGTFGRVGIIGGSKGMAGSICLSAMAAMRCGVGLTYMRVPKQIIADCLAVIPEALISDDYENATHGTDAVLIGPGMERTQKSIRSLWNTISTAKNLILDAEALNIMANHQKETEYYLNKRRLNSLPWIILTPHPGEFCRLAPDLASLNRIDAAKAAARRFDAILVLKGAGTVIADPQGGVYINTSGNSGMAKGGSGDVLAGMIAAFVAQGKTPMEASAFAVFLHGLCGDLAARETGENFAIPSDFIKKIPDAFRILSNKGEQDACKISY